MMTRNMSGGSGRRWLKLSLMLMLLMTLVHSEWALIDVKDPSGDLRVDDARMSTSSGGYCGYETAQSSSPSSCNYQYAYSTCDQEGDWKATVTVKTRHCTALFLECTGGSSNTCNNAIYCGVYQLCCESTETSNEQTLYNINWDGDPTDCSCIGGTWLNNQCCGDDENADDYENPGTGNSCCIDGTVVASGNSKDGLTCTNGQIGGFRAGCDAGQYVAGISSTGEITCGNDPGAISLLDAGDDLTASGTTDRTLALGSNIDLSKLIVEGSIKYTGSATGNIFYHTNSPGGDGYRIRYNTNDLIIEKTDNSASVQGGIAFINVGYNGATSEALEIQADGDVGIKGSLYGIDSAPVSLSGSLSVPRLKILHAPSWPYESIIDGNGHVYVEGWDGTLQGRDFQINKFASDCNAANARAIRFYPFCSSGKLRMYLQACRQLSGGGWDWVVVYSESSSSCSDYSC